MTSRSFCDRSKLRWCDRHSSRPYWVIFIGGGSVRPKQHNRPKSSKNWYKFIKKRNSTSVQWRSQRNSTSVLVWPWRAPTTSTKLGSVAKWPRSHPVSIQYRFGGGLGTLETVPSRSRDATYIWKSETFLQNFNESPLNIKQLRVRSHLVTKNNSGCRRRLIVYTYTARMECRMDFFKIFLVSRKTRFSSAVYWRKSTDEKYPFRQ